MPEALTLLLAGVFLASGIAKLRDPAGMVVLLRRALSPTAPAFALTRSLAVAEVLLGALLLTGVVARSAALAAVVVLVAFTVALRVAAGRAPEALASCHCFGGAGEAPPAQALVRNGLLIAAGLAVAVAGPASPWELSVEDAVGAVTVAVGLACTWLLATALWAVVGSPPPVVASEVAGRGGSGDGGRADRPRWPGGLRRLGGLRGRGRASREPGR